MSVICPTAFIQESYIYHTKDIKSVDEENERKNYDKLLTLLKKSFEVNI